MKGKLDAEANRGRNNRTEEALRNFKVANVRKDDCMETEKV